LFVRPEFVRSTQPLDPAKYNLTDNDGFDAYLLAGKHSFSVRKEAFAFAWDLTQAWFELTQLPFVVHCWVLRKTATLGNLEKELGDAARRNDASGDIITRSAEREKLSETAVRAI